MADKTIIYTPGHSLYTDTLTMYGLIYSIIAGLGEKISELLRPGSLTVRGLGTHYLIETKYDLDFIAEGARKASNELVREDLLKGGLVGMFDNKYVTNALNALRDVKTFVDYLEELQEPGHARSEGKIGRKGVTFKLPLIPIAGKYFTTDITSTRKYDVKQYNACCGCIGLSMLGLARGALVFPQPFARMVLTISFEGETAGYFFKHLYELLGSVLQVERERLRVFREKKKKKEEKIPASNFSYIASCIDILPLRVLTYSAIVMLSNEVIDAMNSVDARWHALTVKFDTKRGIQVRGYQGFEVDTLIINLAKIIDEGQASNLRSLVRFLLQRANLSRLGRAPPGASYAIDSLDYLTSYLSSLSFGFLYNFTRSYYKASDRKDGIHDLCETLMRLALHE